MVFAALKWLMPKAIENWVAQGIERLRAELSQGIERLKAELELANSRPTEERRQLARLRLEEIRAILGETKAIIGLALYPIASKSDVQKAVKAVSDFLDRVRGFEGLLTREESERLFHFGALLQEEQRDLVPGGDSTQAFARLELARQRLLDFFRDRLGLE